MAGPADKAVIEALHNALATKLTAALAGDCDAATLNQVRQFLKDNDVKCAVVSDNPLDKLGKAVAARGTVLPFEGDETSTH